MWRRRVPEGETLECEMERPWQPRSSRWQPVTVAGPADRRQKLTARPSAHPEMSGPNLYRSTPRQRVAQMS